MQEKDIFEHILLKEVLSCFCVLLNTGQTLNQSLAVQNVAFTDNFNPRPSLLKHVFTYSRMTK